MVMMIDDHLKEDLLVSAGNNDDDQWLVSAGLKRLAPNSLQGHSNGIQSRRL